MSEWARVCVYAQGVCECGMGAGRGGGGGRGRRDGGRSEEGLRVSNTTPVKQKLLMLRG